MGVSLHVDVVLVQKTTNSKLFPEAIRPTHAKKLKIKRHLRKPRKLNEINILVDKKGVKKG